jgi:hypothetical protein
MPPTLRNGMTELLVDVDGLPVLVRFLVKDVSAEKHFQFVSKDADIHLLSRAVERMIDRLRGSSLRSDDPSKQPAKKAELTSSADS